MTAEPLADRVGGPHGSERNYTGYCNAEADRLIDQQSAETDANKRRQIVWQIEKYLAEDGGRPIIFQDLELYKRARARARRGRHPDDLVSVSDRLGSIRRVGSKFISRWTGQEL